jgi:hypothetical protein
MLKSPHTIIGVFLNSLLEENLKKIRGITSRDFHVFIRISMVFLGINVDFLDFSENFLEFPGL